MLCSVIPSVPKKFLSLICGKLKMTVFKRFVSIFSESLYFNLKFGRKL